jgi:hypothetical protein
VLAGSGAGGGGERASCVEKAKGKVGIYGCAAGRGDEKGFGAGETGTQAEAISRAGRG